MEFSSVCHLLLPFGHQTKQVISLVMLSHRLAWNHFPLLRISLHTSHKQKPGWPCAWAVSLSVQWHCFYWVLKAQEKQRTLPFPGWSQCCQQLLSTAGHLPTAKCKCLPLAISWVDGFGLLKYPALFVQALPLVVSSHPWVFVFQGIIPLFAQVSTCPWVSLCVLLLLLFPCCSDCRGVSSNLLGWQFWGTVFFPCIGILRSSVP